MVVNQLIHKDNTDRIDLVGIYIWGLSLWSFEFVRSYIK